MMTSDWVSSAWAAAAGRWMLAASASNRVTMSCSTFSGGVLGWMS